MHVILRPLRTPLLSNLLTPCAMALGIFFSSAASAANVDSPPGTLRITPPDLTYFAVQGDTLISIALRYTDKASNWQLLGKRNKITNNRTIPIGSAILIPFELLPEDASQAKVVALAGDSVVQKTDGSTSPVSLGDILIEGNRLSTGKNAFLSLALPDASRVSIPSNSQVSLTKLRMTRYTKSPRTQITLLQGRIESRVSPLESNKGRFEVRSPLAVAGVRGTHFRVGVIDSGIASEVLSGAVAVGKQEKPASLELAAGTGNVINTVVGQARELLAPPRLTGNFKLQEKPTAQLDVEKMSEARAYRAQIALDADAQNILMETFANGEKFKFDGLPDGQYFASITAFDAFGLEGKPSMQSFTLKARPEPPFSLQPKAKLRAENVRFVWTEAADASSYRLQVASDAQFKTLLLDQADIAALEYDTGKLANGNYFWRVATVAQINGAADQGPFGDPQAFNLSPVQAMNPVSDTGGNVVSLSWPSEPGQKFLLEIARDVAFTTLFLSKELDQPEISIARPEAGSYFIRVKATDADGYVGAFSATQKLSIFSRWLTGSGEPLSSVGGVVRAGQ